MPGRRSPHRVWLVAGSIYVGLTLLYAWPLLWSFTSTLPSDTGDPALIAWVLWWNAHAVPLTSAWWNAPIFVPIHGAFALSETFLGVAPLTTPLLWIGVSPVVVYNIAFLLSFPTAALAAHALAHRLTGRHDAAFIAGLAFGFSPYRASQIPHMHLLWSCWMPLGLLALHRFLAERRRRDLALLALCWVFNGLVTGYYLIFFAVLAGLWFVWFVRRWRDGLWIGGTLLLASLLFAPLVAGYDRNQRAIGDLSRGIGEIETFSADLTALWSVSFRAWLPYHWTLPSRPEGELYPGAMVLILVGAGLLAGWPPTTTTDRRRSRTQIVLVATAGAVGLLTLASWMAGGLRIPLGRVNLTISHPHKILTFVIWLLVAALLCDRRLTDAWRRRSAFVFYVMAAGALMFLALGPTPQAFGERFMYKAPYAWLMELPGGHAIRVPARFAMLIVLCLSQAAALAYFRLTRRGRSVALVVGVSIVIALEGWVPKLTAAPIPAFVDLTGLNPRTPVLELPVGELYGETAAMLRATAHGHPILNGYSGYLPPYFDLMAEGFRTFDPSVLPAIQQFGPLVVIVDVARDPAGRYRALLDGTPDAVHVRDTSIGPAYSLPARPQTATPDHDPALPIASVSVSGSPELAPLLTDGAFGERWFTPEDQSTRDFVVANLAREATISAVELDMGPYGGGYPRKLRISVSDGVAAPVPVWEGRTAGLLVLGALHDFFRTPIAIELPPNTHGRQVVLSILEDTPNAPWSLAEIRVLGR